MNTGIGKGKNESLYIREDNRQRAFQDRLSEGRNRDHKAVGKCRDNKPGEGKCRVATFDTRRIHEIFIYGNGTLRNGVYVKELARKLRSKSGTWLRNSKGDEDYI